MPTHLLALFCLVTVFLTSCSEPKDLEFKEFKNLKVENLNFFDAILKVDLVYHNPNNFGLQLSSTDLDLFVDSSFLGHSAQNIQVAIPRKGDFTLPLQVNLDVKNLLKNGLNSLFNREIAVRLLGKVKVGKGGVYKSFNVDYTSMQNFSLFK